jgi:PAS domain S-box-containing protein
MQLLEDAVNWSPAMPGVASQRKPTGLNTGVFCPVGFLFAQCSFAAMRAMVPAGSAHREPGSGRERPSMPSQSTPLALSADSIVDTVREPLLVLSADLRVKKANRSFFLTFQVAPEETVGQLIYDLGNKQWDIPLLRELLEEVLPDNMAFDDFEVDHVFPGIGRKQMLLNARRIRGADNTSESILLAIEDVTARREAEEARRAIEDRYSSLVQNIRDHSIFMMDIDGAITTWNAEAERIIGYGESEILGRNFSDIFTPEDQQRGLPQTELRLARENGRAEDERWHVRKDGSRFWALGIVTPMRGADGSVTGFSKILRDMTERKRVEAALQKSETRYRRLFQTAKDGILILDVETGRVIDANPFMTALLGYSQEEFVTKELWEIGLFQDIEENRSAFRELREKGYVRYEHLPLETKSGQSVEVEFVSNVYAEDDRQVIQCNIRDITIRCRLEQQTQDQAAALADLSRRKDEFLAMLSHELRNPLAPILNAVQLLSLQVGENLVQQKARAIIERQLGQLTHLVDDLMEVSRAITGRIELRREEVSLGGIVERAVETARPPIDQRRHELVLSLPPDPIWLFADAARFEQVVTNLLTNAAKYTQDGGRIGISAGQEGDTAVLRVSDSGMGITPAFLPHVFELFTQAERSSERSQGGLGIGLALVKRLVEMHDGTIDVSSTLGQGSEFVVRLPMHRPAAPSDIMQTSPAEVATPAAPSLRVLIVDDNVDAATTLEMLVEQSGHQTWMAHTGPAGLAAAIEHRPDVMLLDIGLPGIDGYQVAQRIRRQPSLHDVVLVAMTGYGQETDRRRSRDAGFDHHLVKPTDFSKVQQILTTVLERAT